MKEKKFIFIKTVIIIVLINVTIGAIGMFANAWATDALKGIVVIAGDAIASLLIISGGMIAVVKFGLNNKHANRFIRVYLFDKVNQIDGLIIAKNEHEKAIAKLSHILHHLAIDEQAAVELTSIVHLIAVDKPAAVELTRKINIIFETFDKLSIEVTSLKERIEIFERLAQDISALKGQVEQMRQQLDIT